VVSGIAESGRPRRWVVGMTGASGCAYGIRLIETLLAGGFEVHLVISDAGWRVLREEAGWDSARRAEELDRRFGGALTDGRMRYYPSADVGANVASGSFRTEGMVIAPCSMGTLSAIANGASDNLVERAADVALKEGRRLLLMPRESPLHAIHLENMLKLARLGVRIVPAMPAFYYHPASIRDMIDFMVGKLLDNMGIDHDLYRRWGDDGHGGGARDHGRPD